MIRRCFERPVPVHRRDGRQRVGQFVKVKWFAEMTIKSGGQ